MLVLRGPGGLGQTVNLKVDPKDVVIKPGGGVYTPERAPTSNIQATPMSWGQLSTLYKNFQRDIQARNQLLLKAFVRTLNPTCSQESRHPPRCVGCGPTCYNHAATSMAEAIPGGFQWLGVPFNIVEVGLSKSPKFERAYTPNNEQRFEAEYYVINKSRNLQRKAVINELQKQGVFGADAATMYKRVNVDQVIKLLDPRWKLGINNMSIRSVSPTQDEFLKKGGWEKWINRGGFLISLDVAEGHVAVMDSPICPRVCMSLLCACPGSPYPACIGGGVPTSDNPNISGCFFPYIRIDQSAPWLFHASLIHDDPNWLERFGEKINKALTEFSNLMCGNKELAKQQTSSAVAAKCVDKDGKPCTQGSTGCTCTSPGAAAEGGVGIWNFWLAAWCLGWDASQVRNPTQPMPPVPDPPPMPPGLLQPSWYTFVPWVIGGLTAGAYAFSRK